MVAEWAVSTIGEQVLLQRGFDITKRTQRPGIVPVVSTAGPMSFHDTAMAQGPGVILGRKGNSIGRAHFITQDYWPHDTTLWVKDFKGNDPRFVYYFFLEKFERLQSLDVGSANPTLNRNHVHPIPVLWPPPNEQQRIAHILGTIDDKIELNRRMNTTLEAMAQAIFQSWFVDFDPVKRNAGGGDSRPEDALFPVLFENSVLGDIPKGWKLAKVSEICKNIFSGGTPRTSEVSYWDGSFPWLSSGETRNSFITETEKTITQLGIDKSSTRLARSGCVVIASAGQGHTRGQTSLLAFDSYINQSVVALAANNAVASDLFLYFDLSRRYEEFRQLSDSHSSRGSLTTKLLGGIQVVLPAKDAIQKFDSIVSPLVARIISNLQQSGSLATLRDALLPKLLCGELTEVAVVA
jgi:type I restriction enzyme, S subunit